MGWDKMTWDMSGQVQRRWVVGFLLSAVHENYFCLKSRGAMPSSDKSVIHLSSPLSWGKSGPDLQYFWSLNGNPRRSHQICFACVYHSLFSTWLPIFPESGRACVPFDSQHSRNITAQPLNLSGRGTSKWNKGSNYCSTVWIWWNCCLGKDCLQQLYKKQSIRVTKWLGHDLIPLCKLDLLEILLFSRIVSRKLEIVFPAIRSAMYVNTAH